MILNNGEKSNNDRCFLHFDRTLSHLHIFNDLDRTLSFLSYIGIYTLQQGNRVGILCPTKFHHARELYCILCRVKTITIEIGAGIPI